MLLGTVRENEVVIARSKQKAAADHESAYEKTRLTIKTGIKALQEVDPLAKRRQTALSMSKNVVI